VGEATISKIVEVIQGDKFVINIDEPHQLAGSNINVNLRKVDAPDVTKSCPKQLEHGLKVKNYVTKKLANATSIKLINIKKTNTKVLA
jgi:endonuclease YncB( thermonuclease family)